MSYGTRSPDNRWWWDGATWQPVRLRHKHPIGGVFCYVVGITLVVLGGITTIGGFAGLISAPAIQGGAFFGVMFAGLIVVGAGVLLIWIGKRLRRWTPA